MWSEPRDAALVYEMMERISLIEGLVSGRQRDAFLADMSLPHALALHFPVLGETASKLSKSFRAEVPGVEWQKVINLRHLIAHEYRLIDHAELWRLCFDEVSQLKAALPDLPPPATIF
ncbi:DUF86 domain-containing protein [Brevundimonas sp.]|uniref:HepT-like ribonuclease domain-containing protein n=1 Tax=Brevundimonas sp. TaxID=1871086 RepID=UPI002AB934E4|nr:HepT-like ribonuclease domain-containing protein [Brevundimonas sp.]MDZ4364370.1 HepT-like ribonuclease domain-containing protein [Brevundimonas sp.]